MAGYRCQDIHASTGRWESCCSKGVVRSHRLQDRDEPQAWDACTLAAKLGDQEDGVALGPLELAATAPRRFLRLDKLAGWVLPLCFLSVVCGPNVPRPHHHFSAVGGVTALVPPLYLSHEACRVFPEAVASASLAAFLPAAGAGAVASSGLPALLARESAFAAALVLASRSAQARRPQVSPAPVAAAAAAALALSPRGLQALLMTGMLAGGAGGSTSAAALGVGAAGVLPPASSTASVGLGGGQGEPAGGDGEGRATAAPASTEAKTRRGSTVFAGYDVVRLTHPVAVRPTVGASSAAAASASQRVLDAVAVWQPAAPAPAAIGGCVPRMRRNRRVAREVTRWEEISGNMPRWSLSLRECLACCGLLCPLQLSHPAPYSIQSTSIA